MADVLVPAAPDGPTVEVEDAPPRAARGAIRTEEVAIATTAADRRPTRTVAGPVGRRAGRALGAAASAVLLVLVNDPPGWRAVPFLTEDVTAVLGIVNASLVVGAVVNAALVVRDPPWLDALGDVGTTSVGLAALTALWQVYPFAFADAFAIPSLLTRWVLAFGIAASVIGVIVAMVRLTNALARWS